MGRTRIKTRTSPHLLMSEEGMELDRVDTERKEEGREVK